MMKVCLAILMVSMVSAFGCRQLEEPMQLQYIMTDDISGFSLSPYDSDALSNLTVMEQVVGTLVKYEPTGRYGPFLAHKWESEENGKKWIFHLKDGLFDEKGSKITAPRYVESLNIVLKKLSQAGKLPTFDLLKGWKDYIQGKNSLAGIAALDEKTLLFHFDKAPDALIDYLAMPYYGFYSPGDFQDNGDWKDPSHITASGAYRVKKLSAKSLTLEKRKEHWDHSSRSPQEVVIRNQDFPSALGEGGSRTIILRKMDEEVTPPGFRLVRGTPTILTSLVMSPHIPNVFDEGENRKIFIQEFLERQKERPFHSFSAVLDNQFFVDFPTETPFPLPQTPRPKLKAKTKDPLKIIFARSLSERESRYLKEIISSILDKHGIPFLLLEEDRTRKDWLENLTGNRTYDLRVARVDTGSVIDHFIIKMMFCSKLGISFPDPSGKICRLVEDHGNGVIDQEEFGRAFNRLYREEAVVLPVFHSGLTWLFGSGVNLATVSSTMGLPRFDLLELR